MFPFSVQRQLEKIYCRFSAREEEKSEGNLSQSVPSQKVDIYVKKQKR